MTDPHAELKEQFPDFQGNWDHLAILLEGAEAWNAWREEHPAVEPNLDRVDLGPREDYPALGEIWGRHVGPDLDRWEAHLENANLENAVLCYANLESVYLEKVNLRNANLQRANLRTALLGQADLEGADFGFASLNNAEFHNCSLRHANLQYASLEHSGLQGARLDRANLRYADLSNAVLIDATLDHAKLEHAKLERVRAENASFKNARMKGAYLKNARLHSATMENADLRVSKPRHLRLDDTMIRLARFAPASADPWSVVRRAYSGPALLFHLLFLVAFFLPLIGKAAYWRGINQAQEAFQGAQISTDRWLAASDFRITQFEIGPDLDEALAEAWADHGLDPELLPAGTSALKEASKSWALRKAGPAQREAVQHLLTLGPCLEPECAEPRPLIVPLLGLEKPCTLLGFPLWVLPSVLLAYNFLRGGLTWWVSQIREAEERSRWSPRLKQYIWVYWTHKSFMQWIPIAAVTAAAFQIIEWLFLVEVVLPLH